MQRLGMVNADEDFDHPNLPVGHELRSTVVSVKPSSMGERTQV